MSETSFVYVTYIRTTPEKLWQALASLKSLLETGEPLPWN